MGHDATSDVLVVAGLAHYTRFGFAMKPTAWSKFLGGGGEENITINHPCGGGDCGGSGNSDGSSDGDGGGGGNGGDGGGRESDGGVGGGRGDDSYERRRQRRRWIQQQRATAMAEAACACSNRRCGLIGSWVTPPTTGTIEIERGGDKNITTNHGCRQGEAGRQAARRWRRAARR